MKDAKLLILTAYVAGLDIVALRKSRPAGVTPSQYAQAPLSGASGFSWFGDLNGDGLTDYVLLQQDVRLVFIW